MVFFIHLLPALCQSSLLVLNLSILVSTFRIRYKHKIWTRLLFPGGLLLNYIHHLWKDLFLFSNLDIWIFVLILERHIRKNLRNYSIRELCLNQLLIQNLQVSNGLHYHCFRRQGCWLAWYPDALYFIFEVWTIFWWGL